MYYIILNPSSKSGRGIKIWKKLEHVFIEKDIPYRMLYSKQAGHISQLIRRIIEKHAEEEAPVNVILLGGDGTLNEALQGVADFSKINFGYIPTGSSNDFARDMKLPRSPLKILTRILECGKENHVSLADVGVLNYVNHETRYFAVSEGIGFDAAVCEEAMSSSLKNVLNKLKLGKLTYLGIALKQLIQAKSISCDLTLDNDTTIHMDHFLFVAAMLRQYEGGGFKFCPGADATDGILDLCVVGPIPKWLILLALPTAFFGKHYLFPYIDHYTAKEIEIKTASPLWVHTDGEVHTKSQQIRISCCRQTLRFLI